MRLLAYLASVLLDLAARDLLLPLLWHMRHARLRLLLYADAGYPRARVLRSGPHRFVMLDDRPGKIPLEGGESNGKTHDGR